MIAYYAEGQFGKPLTSIDKNDIVMYFYVERDESLSLEFKSFVQREGDIKHKENGVLRSICAFLNSSGGLVIWGAPQGSVNLVGQKVFTGALSPVEKRYSKDDFISKISNRIIPYSRFVHFHSVEIEENKFVYLIEVDESETKPHQLDNVYYARLDGQTKPAPHYLIDALFKQVRLPSISGYVRITSLMIEKTVENSLQKTPLRIELKIMLFNNSVNINDRGFYFSLKTFVGQLKFIDTSGSTIDGETQNISNGRFLDNNQRMDVEEPTKLMAFGAGASYISFLTLTYGEYKEEFEKHGGLTLLLVFGSTKSNMKRSKYFIKLTDKLVSMSSQIQNYTTENSLNTYMSVTREENKHVKDLLNSSNEDNIYINSGI